jgi:diguanylate cyclase (GGDEF)-like protein
LKRHPVLRRFLVLFVPAMVLVIASEGLVYLWRQAIIRNATESSHRRIVSFQRRTMVHRIAGASSDLMFLANLGVMRAYAGSHSTEHTQDLIAELVEFLEWRDDYDQIRVLDTSGMERVRVNRSGGTPHPVAETDLQAKGHRYYVAEALRLEPGEVYISRFDLNVEHGAIEQPPKAVIRFATPLLSADGSPKGIVVLNHIGNDLVETLAQIGSESVGHAFLLDAEGYWLLGAPNDGNWAFMFPERRHARFPTQYPDVWNKMSESHADQLWVAGDLFSFAHVDPTTIRHHGLTSTAHPMASWIIGYHATSSALAAEPGMVWRRILVEIALLALVLLILSRVLLQLGTMKERSLTDPLTGLPNRRDFDSRMATALADYHRYGTPASVLVCDVDRFKRVNDRYGHAEGDKVLVGIARILRSNLRDTDCIARYGGEEFAVLLRKTSESAARIVAEKLRAAVGRAELSERVGRVTISVGLAALQRSDAVDDVFERADSALYAAKQNGRNAVVTSGETVELSSALPAP